MSHKFGVIAMPFEMWRLLTPGNITSHEQMAIARQAQHIVAQQIASQSLHANCGSPAFTTRGSRQHQDLFELVATCDCGEELTIIDGLDKDALVPIGVRGALQPIKHQA